MKLRDLCNTMFYTIYEIRNLARGFKKTFNQEEVAYMLRAMMFFMPGPNTPNAALPFQRRQFSNHIAEHIRGEILDGTRRPGEFLRLDEVAKQLGVSVTPVREALVSLSVEGFVKHAERRGFLVSNLRRSDLEDLYALLAQVAARLAERAAMAMNESELELLSSIHGQMVQAANDGNFEQVEYTNDEFHRVINRAADSPKLAWVLLSILKYVPKRSYAGSEGFSKMLVEHHLHILQALEQKDSKGAHSAMYKHEEETMAEVLEILDRRGVFEAKD
ncbi:GntR family transcriptional regulator [Corynebacterium glutamicum]|nr:GntR family transcriptional regulator [Corynebacterium glutamicum]NII88996.1 DNA-binding GntR family transcriptional regulator [Corynebacterium glutamicum]